jgi:bifunctional DNA-binding transcriptional regulator/antitoxin component of YhaV-PrlF toxin-antitoxin module
MSKVTGKLQVTLPKAIAQALGARDKKVRLRIFDQATERQRKRQRKRRQQVTADRGWTREELYERGRAR